VAEHVGGSLGHQDFDLVHGAAELQVAQVEAGGQAVGAAPLVRQDVLQTHTRTRCFNNSVCFYTPDPAEFIVITFIISNNNDII